jgi:hypothetical protein
MPILLQFCQYTDFYTLRSIFHSANNEHLGSLFLLWFKISLLRCEVNGDNNGNDEK